VSVDHGESREEVVMSNPISVSLGNNNFTVNTGDLTEDTLAHLPHGALSLASDVLDAAFGQPIATLSTDVLEATLSAGQPLQWTIGNITLQFSPQFTGSVSIRKAGEVFRFTEAERDDDPALRRIVTVPAGKAYVSIALRVNIGVAAAGGFSSGAIGVKGSAQLTDTFLLANHCLVDATANVGTAIAEAFARFLLPFTDGAYRRIGVGDFLEYQFYGKLDVNVDVSMGFGGVLFGGASGGDLRRSFSSPIGQVTASAQPSFNLGVTVGVGYKHEDAFRIVLQGLTGQQSQLFLFKMDQSTLSASLQATAGVALNASIELDTKINELIDGAAQRLFAGVTDVAQRTALIAQFVSRIKGTAEELNRFVQEAEDAVNEQLAKLNKLKVSASIAFERISEHAALFSMTFDRTAPPAGYVKAVHGDMRGALGEAGTDLGIGSYIRSEIRKTTTLSVQLFETFNITSITTYFEKTQLRYVGKGIFQFRSTTGVQAENNVFGHRKAIEFYFEITAAVAAKGTISDKDIRLRITTTEEKQAEAARRTAGMLHLVLKGSAFEGVDDALRRAIARKPNIPVQVSLVFAPSAYQRLRFSPFVGGKPTADQAADALNYAAFVHAVDLIYAGSGFGTEGFPDLVDEFKNWARYNVRAIDEESSTKPPNRRERGNGNTRSIWPQDPTNFPAALIDSNSGIRDMLRVYMLAGQQFMNFCEDLPKLSRDLDQAATEEALGKVLDEAKDLVKEGSGSFPLFFTKPLAAALTAQARGVITALQAPAPDTNADAFNVEIEIG
jgi:hypothetical protein